MNLAVSGRFAAEQFSVVRDNVLFRDEVFI
jgi:hypothetical protein